MSKMNKMDFRTFTYEYYCGEFEGQKSCYCSTFIDSTLDSSRALGDDFTIRSTERTAEICFHYGSGSFFMM